MVSGSQAVTSELNNVDDFQSDERMDQIAQRYNSHLPKASVCLASAYCLSTVAPDQLSMSHEHRWTEDSG